MPGLRGEGPAGPQGPATHLLPRRQAWALLAVSGLVGLGLAAWLGLRSYQDALAVERLRFEAVASLHLGAIRDHLTARETTARAVAATFRPPGRIEPSVLAAVDRRFLSLVPDITSFVWVPRVEPAEVPAALRALEQAGVPEPALLGPGRRRMEAPPADRAILPVLDIEPKSPANLTSLGLDLASLPAPRAALAEAERQRDAAATAPLELVQFPGEKALVLYVPVVAREEGAAIAGYLGFSYRYAILFGQALGGAAGTAPVSFSVAEPAAAEAGVLFRAGPAPPPGLDPWQRPLEFGGRRWQASYWPVEDIGRAARDRGLSTFLASATAIALVLAVAAYLAGVSRRMEAALAGRAMAEERLRAVATELNHRTKNLLAVVQALVSRSLRGEGEIAARRETLLGRLRAMAEATTLLAQSEWRGLRLGEVLGRSGLPFADRVHLEGQGATLVLAPGAAQGIVLLIHELWTNAAKHGALTREEGSVRLSCEVAEGRFRLLWAEEGGPPATLPAERGGFGRDLLERIVPRGLGGEGRLEGRPAGLRYTLEAPADRVVAPADPAGPPALVPQPRAGAAEGGPVTV